jgi:hypothetical protein
VVAICGLPTGRLRTASASFASKVGIAGGSVEQNVAKSSVGKFTKDRKFDSQEAALPPRLRYASAIAVPSATTVGVPDF